jgi:putative transposase
MIKLKQRQKNGEFFLTNKRISGTFGITIRRVQQIWNTFVTTGEVPKLHKPGPSCQPLSEDERRLVMKAYRLCKSGAKVLEEIIFVMEGVKISHNRMHRFLLGKGLAKKEPNKRKQRKWVRYEREHSMSLWHTDYKLLDNGDWIIAYQDDASRRIMAYGTFPNATADHAIEVLTQAIKNYGNPDAILTDRGSQFYASKGETKKKGESKFEEFLRCMNIKHIVARVNHPQTNGKIKRFFGTIQRKQKHFQSLDEFMY